MNIERLNTISRSELIELIVGYSENGYFPISLFLLKADCMMSSEEITECWNQIYSRAALFEKDDDHIGACYLRDATDLCLEQIKKLTDVYVQKDMCQMIVQDLEKACVQDGIGMYTDSEWIYQESEEKVRNYLVELDR